MRSSSDAPRYNAAHQRDGRSKGLATVAAVRSKSAHQRAKSSAGKDGDSIFDIPAQLRPTDDPDVFVNAAGSYVDRRGVLLGLQAAVESEIEAAERILGKPVETPAEFLKRIALDPILPFGMRMDAAKAAAPYYDMRMPLRVEGDIKQSSTGLDPAKLSAMPREDREALLKLLKKAGAVL